MLSTVVQSSAHGTVYSVQTHYTVSLGRNGDTVGPGKVFKSADEIHWLEHISGDITPPLHTRSFRVISLSSSSVMGAVDLYFSDA
jgi:hypothetical protein